MLIRNALVFRNCSQSFEEMDIRVESGRITELGKLSAVCGEEICDACGAPAVSGLVDVHTHGRAGYDFVSCPADALHTVAASYAECGVTSVMPAIASAPLDEMKVAAARIDAFCAERGEAYLCGVHLEGRYLNPAKKGAHAPELLAPLNADELEDEVFRMCRRLHISAAWELDADGAFAAKAREMGATLSLGHTAATYREARVAEERGVTAYTHLFNAMPPLHHRDGGAVCAALTGDCFGELICDGVHVSPEMIRLAYSSLGSKRTVLISDSMEATGCPDGEYSIAGNPAFVKNGMALTPDGALAGSTLTLDKAVENLMRFCGITLEEAIPCATENPAREIGAYDELGSIDVGKRADILLLEDTGSFKIRKIMINGEFISK